VFCGFVFLFFFGVGGGGFFFFCLGFLPVHHAWLHLRSATAGLIERLPSLGACCRKSRSFMLAQAGRPLAWNLTGLVLKDGFCARPYPSQYLSLFSLLRTLVFLTQLNTPVSQLVSLPPHSGTGREAPRTPPSGRGVSSVFGYRRFIRFPRSQKILIFLKIPSPQFTPLASPCSPSLFHAHATLWFLEVDGSPSLGTFGPPRSSQTGVGG